MSNYLELKVPIRGETTWFKRLRRAMAAADIPVRWQRGWYHITVAFIEDDQRVATLREAFDRVLTGRHAPLLTLDRVDAFRAKNRPEVIVNLTSSQPSPELLSLMDTLRNEVLKAGVHMECDFRLHITLGRTTDPGVTEEQVRNITDGMQVQPFTLALMEAEYRYFRGACIRHWKMN